MAQEIHEMTPAAAERLVPAEALERACRGLLTSAGASPRVAQDVSRALCLASLRGIDTHGVSLLPSILARLEEGRSQARLPAVPLTGHAARPVAVVDARRSPGHHAGLVAARLALAKALRFGIGLVSVRNSTHFGCATPFLLEILSGGCAAVAGSNSVRSMAAFGAGGANLGNNPFGFALPAGETPFVFDSSSAVMSYGRRNALRAAGREVSAGAFRRAVPPSGAGSAVYELTGTLDEVALPFGGHKGASLAVLVEAFSALLSGGAFGKDTETGRGEHFRGPSHFFLAVDPRAFPGGLKRFTAAAAGYAAGLRSAGAERLPGDRAARTEVLRRAHGVPLEPALAAKLRL